VPLTMAPHAFDDRYRGCREQTMRQLPKLNRTEFAANGLYAKFWGKAAALWQSRGAQGSLRWPEEAIALLAYTLPGRNALYERLNAAVRSGGCSRHVYWDNFHFKVLHFLLTAALQDLGKAETPRGCLRAFRGVRGVRVTARPGQIVRFGHFASSSLNKGKAQKFGTDTFFEVRTCHGASIGNFSFYHRDEEEVLIPPYETFKVTSVTQQGGTTQIRLDSHGEHSN
ncbi:NRT2 ribosyltransferase, partial [Serilophus lunatus]|nr:NRT2 ribosyltransferase [Serilophus lunatus]